MYIFIQIKIYSAYISAESSLFWFWDVFVCLLSLFLYFQYPYNSFSSHLVFTHFEHTLRRTLQKWVSLTLEPQNHLQMSHWNTALDTPPVFPCSPSIFAFAKKFFKQLGGANTWSLLGSTFCSTLESQI